MFARDSLVLPSAFLILSAVSSILLGGVVLYRNPKKPTHRMFAILSLNLALWAIGVLLIIFSHAPWISRALIIATFSVAAFLPATFYQFIALFPYQRFQAIKGVLWFLYAGAILLVVGTNTPWYITALEVYSDRPPVAQYGPVFLGYSVLVAVAMVFSFVNLFIKLRRSVGIQRRQIQHVILGIFVSTGCATITNVLGPVLHVSYLELYGPGFVFIMMATFSYSMVRYHLMDIWSIVSRTTIYAIVTAFVVGTFFATITLVRWVFQFGGAENETITTILAALVISLIIQPLKEKVQLFLDRIILHRRYDAKALVERVSRNTAQFVQLFQLLKNVSFDLQHTVGINAIRVMLVSEKEHGALVTEYSTINEEIGRRTHENEYLLDYLDKNPEPIVLEEVLHQRQTHESGRVAAQLNLLGAHLVVPMRTISGVVGLIAVGEKNTRDIYTTEDVKVFSTLAASLATAIENARLYDKLEELNLHLERIMGKMRAGVIAVDSLGTVTTVNQEARDMFGNIRPGQDLTSLHPFVAELMTRTLRDRRGISEIESTVENVNHESIPVAMSSSCFTSANNEFLGAMVLVFNMGQIKRLESNVHRADRLTSIGTMAAGMAHEIKNPLQSIKTFTQLLLERYEDADFRKTFAEVVPPEVQRIDTIVTRLLDFARPKAICFAPQNLRQIIRAVLALVENQMRRYDIDVTTDYPDQLLTITADDQQLHQVFLNLFLNAIDAMKNSKERVLHIRIFKDRTHLTKKDGHTMLDVDCATVIISDTGCGIPQQNIDQLFNPFFTTKAEGTGLGLSVVHGIISEHGGAIDVSSIPGMGTSITMSFPLAVEEVKTPERVRA